MSRSNLSVHVATTKRDKEILVSKAFVQVASKPLLYAVSKYCVIKL